MADEFLVVKNVSKAFAGVQALDRVSVTICRGEIRCLVGENGSGKSTLIKVISGFYKPDDGEIILQNHVYKRLHPIDAIRHGIQIIYQDFFLVSKFDNENLASIQSLNKMLVLCIERRSANRQEALDRIEVEIDLDVSC